MELIPIIESTLLIFIGLFIVVLIISYIFFVMKKRFAKSEENTTEINIDNKPGLEYQYLIPADTDLNYKPKMTYPPDFHSYNIQPDDEEILEAESGTVVKNRFVVLNKSAQNTRIYVRENANQEQYFSSNKNRAFPLFR